MSMQFGKIHCSKVIHLASILCVRGVKMAAADLIAGREIQPLIEQIGGHDFALELPSFSFWRKQHPLIKWHIESAPYDAIWHIHNEPSGLASVVRQLNPNATIVLDIHDAYWGMGDDETDEEKADLDAADAVIVPSAAYKARCRKPAVQVISGCIGSPLRGERLSSIGGLVYEGGLTSDGWRDYRELFSRISKEHPLAVFSPAATNPAIAKAYMDAGVVIRHLEYRDMLRVMTCFGWSLIGPAIKGCKQFNGAWPNKYAESMQAGVPAIIVGVPECAEHAERNNCGVGFDDWEDALKYLAEHKAPTEIMVEAAYLAAEKMNMQNQIGAIDEAYSLAQDSARRRNGVAQSFSLPGL